MTGRPGPALLLIAHGSRDPRHARTVWRLAARTAALRPGLAVATAFLEHDGPDVERAAAGLAAAGVREVTAVPLLFTRAHHATRDVPAALERAALAHPGTAFRPAGVPGPSPLLTGALEQRLREAGVSGRRASTGVVLAAAGTRDPDAVAGFAELARHWERSGGWRAVRPAFASAARPDTGTAVRALRAAGARRVVVARCMLAPGLLPDRVAAQAAEAGAELTGPVLGDAPGLAALVLRRYAEAVRTPPVPLAG